MKVSNREAILMIATLTVTVFGISFILARPKLRQWTELREQQAAIRSSIAKDRQLIAERPKWEEQYAVISRELTQHPLDKKMGTYWLSLMDRIAARHGLRIIKRQTGEEKSLGDVYELPIEVGDWQGSLEGLVHFLFDLENEGGMLDVRQLYVKPVEKQKALRGKFLLYCAYTRAPADGTQDTRDTSE